MFVTLPKTALLWLVLCTTQLLLVPVASFSLFSKKETPATSPRALQEPNEASQQPLTRGIPPHQRAQYQAELFTCGDQVKTVIPQARINDNYCDCPDGTDEPGTSACSNGVFTCQNEGFKPLQLTSSRVDDGVCDCCDGSDEDGRQVLCENTCDAEAAASRKALQASIQAYEAGSKVRAELIRDVSVRVKDGEATMAALDANSLRVEEEVARLQVIMEGEVAIERAEKATIKQSMLAEYAAFLGLEALQEADLATLICNLFSVFDVIDEDVPDLLVALQKDDAAAMRPAVEVEGGDDDHSDMDSDREVEMDTYGDYHEDYDDLEDEHGEKRKPFSSVPEYKEAAATEEGSVAAGVVYTASNCDLLKIEMDDRLAPFCALETKDLRRFVVNYLISRKATKEAQLIFGFYALKKTFTDSAEFVTEYNGVNNQPATLCPPELEALTGAACGVDEGLQAVMSRHNSEDHKKKGAEDMRSALRNLSSKQADIQKQHREHEDLVKSSKDYVGFFDFLALQNQCFDKPDGQYTYSVCIGKDVKQKDTGGGSSTLLGNFQNPTSGVQHMEIKQKQGGVGPSIRMKFERGQHCHAFGPRSAEVLLECGPDNLLLEASEPSTCFYSFRMQSPVACNDDFARSIGLTPAV